MQLTFQGWPLYTFHRDKKPGDAKGDGQQGVWHVLKL
jgi:predicted lipoprotein with Yx(FWY)xxD motif